MIELQSSLDRLHRRWKYLERVNIISALLTIPPFILAVFWAPFISMKIASALVIVWAIYVGLRILPIKKVKSGDLESNYLQYLEKTKAYLIAQKKLLETSLDWATLTIYPIYLLFWVGVWERPMARFIGVMSFLVLIGLGVFSYYSNKKKVKNEILPSIQKIDELIKTLKD
ncbi:hypothetical protein [Cyclobacterium sp. 1_MG-2023]|uniref:hypothetical protein n=1 Tax=Cyclobacterium sp. 1_MG-2023 TaxID=3062681 RepID=UPI0026E1B44B|nr:hypothetical protein [Cyclobacterium sp. 1_MG-2023]